MTNTTEPTQTTTNMAMENALNTPMPSPITTEYYIWTATFVAIALGAWYLSRIVGQKLQTRRVQGGHGMTIVDTLHLSPTQRVFMVQAGDEKFLVSAGRYELSAPTPLKNTHPFAPDFQQAVQSQKTKSKSQKS